MKFKKYCHSFICSDDMNLSEVVHFIMFNLCEILIVIKKFISNIIAKQGL